VYKGEEGTGGGWRGRRNPKGVAVEKIKGEGLGRGRWKFLRKGRVDWDSLGGKAFYKEDQGEKKKKKRFGA